MEVGADLRVSEQRAVVHPRLTMEQQARPDVENVAANDQEEMEDMDMDVGPQSLVVLQVWLPWWALSTS